MKFHSVATEAATGAILAHAQSTGYKRLKKGHVLTEGDIKALCQAGVAQVTVAELEPGDLHENEAARLIAQALAGQDVRVQAAFTGRCNLYSERAGLAMIDADTIERINSLDEAITIATVPPFEQIEPNQMLATVKIIPFAAPAHAVEAAVGFCTERPEPPIQMASFRAEPAGLIVTELPDTKASTLDKTVEAVTLRLETLGSRLAEVRRSPHAVDPLASDIRALYDKKCTPILIFGASAITDRRDVIPAAIIAAGGTIEHFGMPVDPGNLLLLGRIAQCPIVGVPGCARSPKFNGFDWVLQRLLAGLTVTARDIQKMGVGGLLKEISSRPQPRASEARAPHAPRIAAIILAAGRARRMGHNKLLALAAGKSVLSATLTSVAASQARPLILVTGFEADQVKAAAAGFDVTFVHNPAYQDGLSSSIREGIKAVPPDCTGAIICLGDMPLVSPAVIDQLIAAFNPIEGRAICIPTYRGKRGNPVLIDAEFFADLIHLSGDAGARQIIHHHTEQVCEVSVDDEGILFDIDTPDALKAFHEQTEHLAAI